MAYNEYVTLQEIHYITEIWGFLSPRSYNQGAYKCSLGCFCFVSLGRVMTGGGENTKIMQFKCFGISSLYSKVNFYVMCIINMPYKCHLHSVLLIRW